MKSVTIIGGGFAGVEAAWAAANRGCQVTLYEMRPDRQTAVHKTGDLAELVCSNSFKSNLLTNAAGILKEEMRMLGSLILPIAHKHRVPAGEALAVDREPFSQEVTATLSNHPNITILRQEVTELPADRPLIIATGPLTSESLAPAIQSITGSNSLYFYDAVAPTVTLDSLDMTKVFRASRRGKSSGLEAPVDVDSEEQVGCVSAPTPNADYLNCPLNKEEYFAFYEALIAAEQSVPHNPDDEKIIYFEMCMPIEEMARRGPRTLAFGPMKPVGLDDPRTGRWPYAVVQLRQENKEGTLWGLVGFQTRMKWGEQKRVLRLIPGLENAEFVRYGVMHRNTYVNAPTVLNNAMEVKSRPGLFLAGQMTGVEGYLESAAIGILAGINAARVAADQQIVTPPRETALGSLCSYLTETEPKRFAPMNANFGIMPELPEKIKDKREKAKRKGEIALNSITRWVNELK